MNIQNKIKLIEDSAKKPVKILKNLEHNHEHKIEKIYYYKNDTFVECSNPDAYFWNIVKPYIMHFAKNIDGDVKDFRGIARGEANYYQSWILDLKLKKWADDYNLGVKVDDLTQLVSEFGSYIWKLVKTEKGYDIQNGDLRNIKFNPKVESIRETDIVEVHYLTENKIKEKKDVWDNVDKIIEKNKITLNNGEEIIFKEFTGYDEDGKYVNIIGTGEGEDWIEVVNNEIDKSDNPYFDFHLDKYSGVWLRKGAYETNFILMERANTLINENAEATAIASLLLMRSNTPDISGNVLRGTISGQIIQSQDLQQIAIDNRAAGLLLGELDRIENQVRKNLLLPDVATGEAMPSGTTFRGQALMSNAYKSAFKQIRNRILTPIKDIIQDKIIPDLIKEWNKEELLELSGDENDIELYDEALKTKRKIEYVLNKNERGEEVVPGELEALDTDTEQQVGKIGRKIALPKKFFNFDYGITIDPVGETYDRAQQNDAIIQAITFTSQNPAVADIPAFKQLLENNGIKAMKLRPETKQEINQMNQGQPLPEVPTQSLAGAVDTNV